MKELVITKPNRGDFKKVFRLLQQLWPQKKLNKPKWQEFFLNCLQNKKREFFIAKFRDRIIAFASLSIKKRYVRRGKFLHIHELVVDKKFRRIGVGAKMLKKAFRVAKAKRCKKVRLVSALHRKAAHAFYLAKGFRKYIWLFYKKI